jgi:hypothetical protein
VVWFTISNIASAVRPFQSEELIIPIQNSKIRKSDYTKVFELDLLLDFGELV